MFRSVMVPLLLALTTLAVLASPSAAQPAPHCPPGEAPDFDNGFAWLKELLGPIMGEPVTCPYVNPANGDVLQDTTTGLAYWRNATNTPTFTTGWEHWAWTERGLLYWTGTSIEPPPGAGVVPPPAAEASVQIDPTSGPPGTTVRVTAMGFPPTTPVEVGVGPWRSEFEVVETAVTDEAGTLTTQVTIPEFADPGDRWVVVVQNQQLPPDRIRAVSQIFNVTATGDQLPQVSTVQIPLIALGEGDLGCNDAVRFVEREIPPTPAPLEAALGELLGLEEQFVGPGQLYNALYQSDLQLESVAIQDSTAVIRLAGQLRLGGVCDNPRVEAQLRQVALQFETVDDVRVFVNGQPLEDALSLR